MDDREVVLAIKAGDHAGLAAAYDRYAAALYGYCYWLLREPAAVDALQKAFVVALTHPGNLDDASQLRSWLYMSARDECYRHIRTAGRGVSDATRGAEHRPDGNQSTQQAELRRLVQATLATLEQDEGEVIELSVRHGLNESEIATVLRLSWSRVHSLSTHARTRLERIFDALLVAHTGRKACLALDALLADWDGRLTVHTGELVGRHVDECETCSSHTHGSLRPEVLAGLLPLATPPAKSREQILKRLSAISEPTTVRLKPAEEPTTLRLKPAAEPTMEQVKPTAEPARDEEGLQPEPMTLLLRPVAEPTTGQDRLQPEPMTLLLRPVAEPTTPTGNPPPGRFGLWTRVRRNPGAATAAAAVLMWVAAAITATLVTVSGLHAVPALAAQNHGRPSIASTPTASTPTAGTPTAGSGPSVTAKPPTSRSQEATQPSGSDLRPTVTPSPSKQAKPSGSASPSASPSPSASAPSSASPTPTRSRSPSPAPSSTSTPTSSPTPSVSAT